VIAKNDSVDVLAGAPQEIAITIDG
jgi:hypothetical protein